MCDCHCGCKARDRDVASAPRTRVFSFLSHRLTVTMLDFRSYRVSVQVDGEDLPVYQPEYDNDTKTASCWIPSVHGQSFTILCKQADGLPYATAARLYLDGNKERVESALGGQGLGNKFRLKGVWTSPTTLVPFQFTCLETTGSQSIFGTVLMIFLTFADKMTMNTFITPLDSKILGSSKCGWTAFGCLIGRLLNSVLHSRSRQRCTKEVRRLVVT